MKKLFKFMIREGMCINKQMYNLLKMSGILFMLRSKVLWKLLLNQNRNLLQNSMIKFITGLKFMVKRILLIKILNLTLSTFLSMIAATVGVGREKVS